MTANGSVLPPRRVMVAAITVVFVLALLVLASLFTVGQTEQVLIVQFGRPVRVISEPGLHAKLPFVQTAIGFERRLINYELPDEEVILGDQRRLRVDAFTMFRITDPLRYYQAVGAGQDAIRARLNSVATSALRRVLGTNKLLDVLSADRARIMAAIRAEVEEETAGFGVTIVDLRIRRADLPPANTTAILNRMKSERVRIASQARAEGAEAATRIRADAERERTVLLADARSTADRLRGEGEAEASRLYAGAYGQDAGFFTTWRTLQAYREALTTNQTRLVLTPDNEFLKLLQAAPKP